MTDEAPPEAPSEAPEAEPSVSDITKSRREKWLATKAPNFGKGPGQRDASEMARLSHVVRRERKDAMSAEALNRQLEVDQKTGRLNRREDLKGHAIAVVLDVAEQLLCGDLKIKNTDQAVRVVVAFFNIVRLEGEQATTINAGVTRDDIIALAKELRDKRTA